MNDFIKNSTFDAAYNILNTRVLFLIQALCTWSGGDICEKINISKIENFIILFFNHASVKTQI